MSMRIRQKGTRGVVLVEAALLCLVITTALFGAVNFGSAWRTKHILADASREAARVASLTPGLQPDDPAILAVVDDVLNGAGLNPAEFTRTLEFAPPLNQGDPIRVRVTGIAQPVVGAGFPVVGTPLPLRASSVAHYDKSG